MQDRKCLRPLRAAFEIFALAVIICFPHPNAHAALVVPASGSLTATGVDAAALNSGGSTYGTERIYWSAPAWFESQINFGSSSSFSFSMTAISSNGTPNVLPSGYKFSVDVYVDGVWKTQISVLGSTTAYQTGTGSPSTVTLSGIHTVRFIWINDAWSSGQYDANLRVRSITITRQGGSDTTPPVISAVASSGITAAAASVSWATNEAATSQVEYGTTTSYGQSTTLDSTLVTAHTVNLSGLAASTLYHYRVKSKDAAGNLATGTDFTFTTTAPPDTTPPTGTITINGGSAAVNTPNVTLTLSATDNSGPVSQMQFSNDGTTYSTAEAYAASKAWVLSAGDGTKTVYARFKDAAGNWTTAVISDTIVLDTTPPSLSFTSPTDGQVIVAP